MPVIDTKTNAINQNLKKILEALKSSDAKDLTDKEKDKLKNEDEKAQLELQNAIENLDTLKDDHKGRLKLRKHLTYFAMCLLIIQNTATYIIIWNSLGKTGVSISDLTNLIGILSSATLLETGFLTKKIFDLVFSELNYNEYKDTKKKSKETNIQNEEEIQITSDMF